MTLTHYKERHETHLKHLIETAEIPATRIKEAMNYTLFPGGKRLRPLLVYLCGTLLNIPIDVLDHLAAAVELIHCYSLVHDDLPAMDNDDLRRGKPSCHRAFDEATAILVGDGMQAFAVELLINTLPALLPAPRVIAIVHVLVNACGPTGMVSGQSLDLSELNNPQLNEPLLRHIHTLKTGRLMQACINMPLAATTPTAWERDALRAFSTHLGLVFQMQDDYLDAYHAPETLGKNRASDAANQKITFAQLYSKDELKSLILHHFLQSEQALLPFNEARLPLLELIQSLQERM